MNGASTQTDGWSFKPGLASVTAVAFLLFLCQLPGSLSFFLTPLTMLSFAALSIGILATAVHRAIQKRPRSAASVLLIVLLPVLLWRPIIRTDEIAHLGLTVGFGAGQNGTEQPSANGGFAVYDWSTGLASTPSTFLIHDATDEITLPMSQHTHPASSEYGFGELCAGKVYRLVKHYYVCTV